MKVKQMMKTLATVGIACGMLFGMIVPVSADTVRIAVNRPSAVLAAEYAESETLTPDQIRAKLDELMKQQGYIPGETPVYYKNCWKFINKVSKKVFGHGIPSQIKNDKTRMASNKNWIQVGRTLSQADSNLNADTLRDLFVNNAVAGDIVQMDYTQTYNGNSDSLHVMMVYEVSQTGVKFLHSGKVVYFGHGNKYQTALYGYTGNEVTYEELYKYLKSSDDGLSVYRSRKVTIPQKATANTSSRQVNWNFFNVTAPEEKKPTLTVNTEFNGPNMTHKKGKNFGLRGVISTDVGTITNVTAYIQGTNGRVFSYQSSPNSASWNARYTVNNEFIFNRLARGTYVYYVQVTATNGSKTSSYSFSRFFTVV